jgi:hypothetical protein
MEPIDAFIDALLKSPDEVMARIRLRLSMTDMELKLLRSDPLRIYEAGWEREHNPFPIHTGERQVPGTW